MMGFGPKHRQLKDPQSTMYLNDEEPATHKEHAKLRVKIHVADGQNYGAAYNAIINQCFIFYASWHCFFQGRSILVHTAQNCYFHRYNTVLPSYFTLTAQTSLMDFIKAHQR